MSKKLLQLSDTQAVAVSHGSVNTRSILLNENEIDY